MQLVRSSTIVLDVGADKYSRKGFNIRDSLVPNGERLPVAEPGQRREGGGASARPTPGRRRARPTATRRRCKRPSNARPSSSPL